MFLYNDTAAIIDYSEKYVTIKEISDSIPLIHAVIFAGFSKSNHKYITEQQSYLIVC